LQATYRPISKVATAQKAAAEDRPSFSSLVVKAIEDYLGKIDKLPN
jgi:hypothetical protein